MDATGLPSLPSDGNHWIAARGFSKTIGMLPRLILAPSGLTALVLLAGCSTPYRNALAPDAARQMQNTSGVIAMHQHEIDTSINPSNLTAAAGGGLLWAIIDAAANAHSAKKTENFAADLRQALLDYKFESDALAALTGRFDQGEGVRLATVVVSADTTVDDLARLVADAPGDAVAVLFVHHLLDPGFTRVVVTANVLVCAKSAALRPLAKEQTIGRTKTALLYRNAFQSSWDLPSDLRPAVTKRENMIVAWATDQGRPVREVLPNACQEIAAMLQWDLSLPAQKSYTERGAPRRPVASYGQSAATFVQGYSAKTEKGRTWVRTVDGRLYGEP